MYTVFIFSLLYVIFLFYAVNIFRINYIIIDSIRNSGYKLDKIENE